MTFRNLLENFKDPVIKQRGFPSLILTDELINALSHTDKREVLRVIGLKELPFIYKKLQRNSISTFTKSKNHYQTAKGMQTNGGILLKLNASPIISSDNDFESDVDVQGTKYIPIHAFSNWKNGKKVQVLLQDYTNKWYTRALSLLGKPQDADWTIQQLVNRDYLGWIIPMINDMTPQIKKELIEYSDHLMTKLIKDNLELIVQVLRDDNTIEKQSNQFSTNEVSVNNAALQGVYLIKDILDIKEINQAKDTCKKLGIKPIIIESNDIGKITRQLKR